MATHSSVLAWRIPGTGEPGGLPSMGSHRVGHDCSGLAAAAAAEWPPWLVNLPHWAAWSPQPPLPTQGLRPNTSTTKVGQNEFLAVQAISSFKPDLQWLPVFLLL